MKKLIMLSLLFSFINILNNCFAQNVGIGTVNPAYKLDVYGSIRTTNSLIVDGSIGIGTESPLFKLQVNNGGIALYNTADQKTWAFNYSSSSNYFYLLESGITRMVIENGGNLGLGITNPVYRLDVDGSIRASSNLYITGNATVDGTLKVNDGKGVAYNLLSASNLKIAPFTTASFQPILGGNQLSAEGSFGLPAGFTSPPRVYVGDIVSTGGTVGELYRVQLIVYGCTTTSCKARLLNTSPNNVNYSITWNMLAVGN